MKPSQISVKLRKVASFKKMMIKYIVTLFVLVGYSQAQISCLTECPPGEVAVDCKCVSGNLQEKPRMACFIDCPSGQVRVPGECKCAPQAVTIVDACNNKCTTYQECRDLGSRGICLFSIGKFFSPFQASLLTRDGYGIAKNRCEEKPRVSGNCNMFYTRYSYDITVGRCVRFVYSGCGGNSNIFTTLRECLTACRNVV